jgi:OFA family oxalate/formate antiporter-like MFS transporter
VNRRSLGAIAGTILVMFSLGTFYAWSVFVQPLEEEFGASRSAVSLVFSLGTVAFTIGMLFGPRCLRGLSAGQAAGVALALAAMGLALSSSLWSLPVVMAGYGGLFGFANGLGYGLSLQVVNRELPHRRGMMTGIAVATYTLGSAAIAPGLEQVIAAWGLASGFLALAILLFLGAPAAHALMKNIPTVAPAANSSSTTSEPVAASHAMIVLWVCFFLGSAVGVLVLSHASPLIASLGGTAEQAAWAVTLVTLGNGLGRLAGGPMCERLPSRLMLAAAALWNAIALTPVLLSPGITTALFAMFGIGVGYGSLASAVPMAIVKSHGAERLSVVYGRLFTAWGAAGLLAPLVGGILFDRTGSYGATLTTSLVLCLAGVGMAQFYREIGRPALG